MASEGHLPAAIASRLDRSSPHGCWLWTGPLDRDGYGRVVHRGKPGRLAHRVVYELLRGPIGEGLVLRHQCEERHHGHEGRRCCSPEHLAPGTPAQNAADRSAKGRSPRQERPAPGAPAGRRRW